MNKKSISPNPQQPVERKPAGQLPSTLAELSENPLSEAGLTASGWVRTISGYEQTGTCSFDGDDE